MEQKFVPPLTKDEFIKRAEPISETAARQIIDNLINRRERMVAPINAEIDFYVHVVAYKETGETSWPKGVAGGK